MSRFDGKVECQFVMARIGTSISVQDYVSLDDKDGGDDDNDDGGDVDDEDDEGASTTIRASGRVHVACACVSA